MQQPISTCLAVILALTLGGCASTSSAREAASSPTTKPATTPPRIVSFNTTVPLAKLRTDDTDIDLRNKVDLSEDDTIYFGQVDTVDNDDNTTATLPIIVRKIKNQWRALTLADRRLPDAEFVFVAQGPAKHEFWAVLDDQIGDPGQVVLLAHSIDNAESWSLTTVRKPHGAGSYESFAMDKNGRGRLTVYLTRRESKGRAGFYHFRTTDNGKTWTGPDYEPDQLHPADEIPDDEDPEPLQDLPSSRTTMLSRPNVFQKPGVKSESDSKHRQEMSKRETGGSQAVSHPRAQESVSEPGKLTMVRKGLVCEAERRELGLDDLSRSDNEADEPFPAHPSGGTESTHLRRHNASKGRSDPAFVVVPSIWVDSVPS